MADGQQKAPKSDDDAIAADSLRLYREMVAKLADESAAATAKHGPYGGTVIMVAMANVVANVLIQFRVPMHAFAASVQRMAPDVAAELRAAEAHADICPCADCVAKRAGVG